MTLQTCAPENFSLCRWGDERTVKCAQTVERGPPIGVSNTILFSIYISTIPGTWAEPCNKRVIYILKYYSNKIRTCDLLQIGADNNQC